MDTLAVVLLTEDALPSMAAPTSFTQARVRSAAQL